MKPGETTAVTPRGAGDRGGVMPPVAALVLDLVLVVVFAAIGRGSHAEGITPAGVLGTAWPFLVGTACGWALAWRVRKVPPMSANDGVLVWIATFALGMPLRALAGGGVAFSFLLVTMLATAILLLGWRFVADLVVARRR